MIIQICSIASNESVIFTEKRSLVVSIQTCICWHVFFTNYFVIFIRFLNSEYADYYLLSGHIKSVRWFEFFYFNFTSFNFLWSTFTVVCNLDFISFFNCIWKYYCLLFFLSFPLLVDLISLVTDCESVLKAGILLTCKPYHNGLWFFILLSFLSVF